MIEMRAEVALLTRNVRVTGVKTDIPEDIFTCADDYLAGIVHYYTVYLMRLIFGTRRHFYTLQF